MNEEYIPEKELPNQPKELSTEEVEIILKYLKKSICKIKCDDGSHGTGFFCNINNWESIIKVLITNNHVLNKESIIYGKAIKFSLNNDSKYFEIKLDKSRKLYTDQNYDVTIIEIKKEDGLEKESFLDLDQEIFNGIPNELYRNKSVFLLHYPKGTKMHYSQGIIKNINEDDNYTIIHLCSTSGGSSGGVIINALNFKVIGIHKGAPSNGKNYNLGTFLKEPIKDFINKIKSDENIMERTMNNPMMNNPMMNNSMMNNSMMNDSMMNDSMMNNPMMDNQMMDNPMMDNPMMNNLKMNNLMMNNPMMNNLMMDNPMMNNPMMNNLMMNNPMMNNPMMDNPMMNNLMMNNPMMDNPMMNNPMMDNPMMNNLMMNNLMMNNSMMNNNMIANHIMNNNMLSNNIMNNNSLTNNMMINNNMMDNSMINIKSKMDLLFQEIFPMFNSMNQNVIQIKENFESEFLKIFKAINEINNQKKKKKMKI